LSVLVPHLPRAVRGLRREGRGGIIRSPRYREFAEGGEVVLCVHEPDHDGVLDILGLRPDVQEDYAMQNPLFAR
jgi:hypothetical protein